MTIFNSKMHILFRPTKAKENGSFLASLILEAFINSISSSSTPPASFAKKIRFQSIMCDEIEQSRAIKGILLDVEFSAEIRKNISRVNFVEILNAKTVLFEAGLDMQKEGPLNDPDILLIVFKKISDSLRKLHVDLLLCQKTIHPYFKQMLVAIASHPYFYCNFFSFLIYIYISHSASLLFRASFISNDYQQNLSSQFKN